MIKKFILPFLVSIYVVFMLFWGLASVPLHEDEADTACYARYITATNAYLPVVWDGKVLSVAGSGGHDVNQYSLPMMQSWLQYYVTKVAFVFLGENTFAARIPFVLIGLLALVLMFKLIKELTGKSSFAYISVLITVSSYYFLLVKLSRYYALAILFSLGIIFLLKDALWHNKKPSKLTWLMIGILSGLFYFSHYLCFGLFWLGLGIYWIITKKWSILYDFLIVSFLTAFVLGVDFYFFHLGFFTQFRVNNNVGIVLRAKYLLKTLINILRLTPIFLVFPMLFFLKDKASKTSGDLLLSMLVGVVLFTLVFKVECPPNYLLFFLPLGIIYTLLAVKVLFEGKKLFFSLLLVVFVLGVMNIDFYSNIKEAVILRQFIHDDSYDKQSLQFFSQNIISGDRVLIYPNNFGMVYYFYHQFVWVGQLDKQQIPNNIYYWGFPADTYNDCEEVDYYVFRGLEKEVLEYEGYFLKQNKNKYKLVSEEKFNKYISILAFKARPLWLSRIYQKTTGY